MLNFIAQLVSDVLSTVKDTAVVLTSSALEVAHELPSAVKTVVSTVTKSPDNNAKGGNAQ